MSRGNFEKCLQPLSIISLDDANNQSMLECTTRFFKYDLIARAVYEVPRQIQVENSPGDEDDKENLPKTPDMIIFGNNRLYFVEFKNGWINKKMIWDVKLKALEGSFIALHHLIAKYKVDVPFREVVELKKVYILVYNQSKFEAQMEEKIEKIKKMKNKEHVESALHLHNKAFKRPIKFGLDTYSKRFFDEVATYTEENFREKLMEWGLLEEADPCWKKVGK